MTHHRGSEPMEGIEVREGETAEIHQEGDALMEKIGLGPQDDPATPGVLVAVFNGTIVLRARPGEAPVVPKVGVTERTIIDAFELAGFAATVELVRTDNNR